MEAKRQSRQLFRRQRDWFVVDMCTILPNMLVTTDIVHSFRPTWSSQGQTKILRSRQYSYFVISIIIINLLDIHWFWQLKPSSPECYRSPSRLTKHNNLPLFTCSPYRITNCTMCATSNWFQWTQLPAWSINDLPLPLIPIWFLFWYRKPNRWSSIDD